MAQVINRESLLKARVQYGHLSKKWHPEFAPFIFMKKNKTHFINLDETLKHLAIAGEQLKRIAAEGGKILFVGRKKQAKEILEQTAKKLDQPYVTLRWLGGTITNFPTIRTLLKQLVESRTQEKDESFEFLTKREKLMKVRKRAKQENILGGLVSIHRLPAALFVVDVNKEMTAIQEARKMNIPVFALVDTTASPKAVDFPIPANDDASESIKILVNYLAGQIEEGIQAYKQKKAATETETPEKSPQ